MDKNHIKQTMLSLEAAGFQSAHEEYLDYVADSLMDTSITPSNRRDSAGPGNTGAMERSGYNNAR